jgi:subtilisin-like proprotein convertase family protein
MPIARPLLLAAILSVPSVGVAAIVEVHSFSPGLGIPDGNPAGLADARLVASAITGIEEIRLTLDISGSFNGDLYATLQHESGFAVLLNRVGRTATNSFGFGDDGLRITLYDEGSFEDIHGQTSGGGLVLGTFGSDGRASDPGVVLETDPRTALLDSFAGLDANGTWTLFVADLAGGDAHTLNEWSMEISGIPEPGSLILLVLSGAFLLRRSRLETV